MQDTHIECNYCYMYEHKKNMVIAREPGFPEDRYFHCECFLKLMAEKWDLSAVEKVTNEMNIIINRRKYR